MLQIERKRHIGNDIVLIVFLDDKTASYCPSLIKSHFIRTLSHLAAGEAIVVIVLSL
jgi:hypothetical protein